MADKPKIGLEAIFESEDFQQGIADYNSAISDSVDATSTASDEMQASFDSLSEAIDSMASDTSDSLSSMTDAIDESVDGAATAVDEATAGMTSAADDWSDATASDVDDVTDSMDGLESGVSENADSVDGSFSDMSDASGDFSENVSETKDSTKGDTDSMADAFDELSGAGTLAFGALLAAVAAVTAELLLAADAALDTEKVMATSAFAVEKFGKNTGITSEQIADLSESISKVVPIDDEVVTQAITMGMTFDGVNHNNIEPLAKAAADLALFTGKDMVSAMKDLGLAVSDPDKAMRLFKEAHITLTDKEKDHLKALKANGDEAKTSAYILGLVTDKVGGFGEALGQTAGGKITIMQTALGNMQEALGEGFLTAISNGAQAITDFASNPETLANLTLLGDDLGFVANIVIEGAAGMANALANNQGIIIGALTAITVALLLAAGAAVALFLATVEISLPLLAVAAAIAIVAALVGTVVAVMATAWIQNWGDIQGKTQAVWKFLEPIFRTIAQVIQFVIGLAIAGLMVQWNALVNTMNVVVDWINVNLMPLFNAIGNLIEAVVLLQLRILGEQFGLLVEAGTAVTDWIEKTFNPILSELGDLIDTYLMPIIRPLADFLSDTLSSAFDTVGGAVQGLVDLINGLAAALNGLVLPPALTPGSPTPFEIGLKGINKELAAMANATLPAVKHQMEVMGTVRDVQNVSGRNGNSIVNTSNQDTKTYIINPHYGSGRSAGLGGLMEGLSS